MEEKEKQIQLCHVCGHPNEKDTKVCEDCGILLDRSTWDPIYTITQYGHLFRRVIKGKFLQNRFGLFCAVLLGLGCFMTVILWLAILKIILTEKGLVDHNLFQIGGTFIMAAIYIFIWFILGIKVLKRLRRQMKRTKKEIL